ncbi:MAG: hypothetical protein ACP5VR_01465 [Acidimicrobiales bacterium]
MTVVQQPPTLLAFLTTSCQPCRPFWEMLGAPPVAAALGAPVVIVTPSRSMESQRAVEQLAPSGVPVHMTSSTWFTYGITKAPSFVLVVPLDGDGPPLSRRGAILGQASVDNVPELLRLVRSWQDNKPVRLEPAGG